MESESVTKSHKKETQPTLRGKWESVFSGKHTDNFPKEIRVVTVMTHKLLETRAVVRDTKGARLLPHPVRRQKQTDGELFLILSTIS